MTHISSEMLAAFSDGELPDEEAAKIEAALERDDLLRARLASLRHHDDMLRAAFAPIADEEMPQRFRDTLEFTGAPVVKLSPRRAWLPAGAAIAAGVTGVVVGAALFTQSSSGWLAPSDATVALADDAAVAASDRLSGTSMTADGVTVTPILSFVAKDGRPCREMAFDGNGAAWRAVACREGEAWRVEALAQTKASSAAGVYRPAGGNHDPVIDGAYKRLGIASQMDDAAERAAIAEGWK